MRQQTLLLIGSVMLAVGIINSSHADSGRKAIEVGLSSHYLIKGNYKPIYDVLVGAEIKYRFSVSDEAHYFVKTVVAGNVEEANSKLRIYSINLGQSQSFSKQLGKTIFADYALGIAYHEEEFSTQLIGRRLTSTFSSWEYQADAGVGIEWSESLRTRVFLSQLGTQGTATGLDISFKF